eukprot:532322-Prymnesium_polylepis.1
MSHVCIVGGATACDDCFGSYTVGLAGFGRKDARGDALMLLTVVDVTRSVAGRGDAPGSSAPISVAESRARPPASGLVSARAGGDRSSAAAAEELPARRPTGLGRAPIAIASRRMLVEMLDGLRAQYAEASARTRSSETAPDLRAERRPLRSPRASAASSEPPAPARCPSGDATHPPAALPLIRAIGGAFDARPAAAPSANDARDVREPPLASPAGCCSGGRRKLVTPLAHDGRTALRAPLSSAIASAAARAPERGALLAASPLATGSAQRPPPLCIGFG